MSRCGAILRGSSPLLGKLLTICNLLDKFTSTELRRIRRNRSHVTSEQAKNQTDRVERRSSSSQSGLGYSSAQKEHCKLQSSLEELIPAPTFVFQVECFEHVVYHDPLFAFAVKLTRPGTFGLYGDVLEYHRLDYSIKAEGPLLP
jgi:hypothetical protein